MRGLSRRTIELIRFAYEVLEAKHPMNLRQLFYTIFSAAKIDFQNTQADYRRLSRVTTTARRVHRWAELNGQALRGIPHGWIVDELRKGEMVNVWDNAAGYIATVRESYRRDLWQDQPAYCEIWSEKASVLASLRPVTEELGVMLRVCRGFGSCGMEGQIGYLFQDIHKPIHIFYLGDHDPSGHDIDRDIYKRVRDASGREFELQRVAIFSEDITLFRLPPQRIKPSDPRAAAFKRRFGDDEPTVELDALPVDELRRRVREAIHELIDRARWNQQIKMQEVELKSIAQFAEQVQTLLPAADRG